MKCYSFLKKLEMKPTVLQFNSTVSKGKKKVYFPFTSTFAGIGDIKRKKLLQQFKNIENIRYSSLKKLQNCSFLNKKDAENIYNFFQKIQKLGIIGRQIVSLL